MIIYCINSLSICTYALAYKYFSVVFNLILYVIARLCEITNNQETKAKMRISLLMEVKSFYIFIR